MDIILDDQAVTREYQLASKTKRFINYIVDYIASAIILIGLMVFLLPIIYPEYDQEIITGETSAKSTFLEYFLAYFAFFIYYFFLEYFTQGKTIGKWLTKTRAVTIDNYAMTHKTALLRSLSRLAPFEAFSFLGASPLGWHDRWTQTKVIMDEGWQEAEYI